ncbi:Uncharacterised protein [Mycobacteroides abscessus subsp. abscessus]|nr:Uncharacterised protein [Mycobacteroides abscessus subsp. abscessus]
MRHDKQRSGEQHQGLRRHTAPRAINPSSCSAPGQRPPSIFHAGITRAIPSLPLRTTAISVSLRNFVNLLM